MKLLLATNNQNKRKEFLALMPADVELMTLQELGILEDIPENEASIEGNSLAKAKYASIRANLPCIAEDTGLEIEALNNEPGVYSARYAGEPANDEANIALVLSKLDTIKNRTARFKTVITYYDQGQFHQFEGISKGSIALQKAGSNGFGYDPVFIPEGCDRSFAQMNFEEKNERSHRKKAIVSFLSYFLHR